MAGYRIAGWRRHIDSVSIIESWGKHRYVEYANETEVQHRYAFHVMLNGEVFQCDRNEPKVYLCVILRCSQNIEMMMLQ